MLREKEASVSLGTEITLSIMTMLSRRPRLIHGLDTQTTRTLCLITQRVSNGGLGLQVRIRDGGLKREEGLGDSEYPNGWLGMSYQRVGRAMMLPRKQERQGVSRKECKNSPLLVEYQRDDICPGEFAIDDAQK